MHRPLVATIVAAAALGAAPYAFADAHLYQPVSTWGYYYSDENVLINSVSGQVFPTGDGSNYQFVTCVGSDPGSPGCAIPPGPPAPPGSWYALPNLPTSAAAQAWTPDYGINRVRTWSTGTQGVNTGDPGYTRYTANANSGWHDEITTDSAQPIVVTFVVALHVSWNDGGVFAYQMGRPGAYDSDVGTTELEGWTWTNCGACTFGYDTGSSRTVLPGGDNGSADLIVTMPFTVNPESFGDPEDPEPYTNPFESFLLAGSAANDAEVEAYSSANLLAILVPLNTQLTFASGHAYNVQVVPEPSTWALSLLGVAGVMAVARRRRARKASGEGLESGR